MKYFFTFNNYFTTILYANSNIFTMKKAPLISVLTFVFSFSYSQITITQADMPSAGDTLRVSFASNALDPALTGANYTWDYSFLTPNSQWVNKFEDPSTFAFPFNLFSFISSFGEKQYTPDSIPGAPIKVDNAYGYFKKSSTNFKQVGYGLYVNSLPVPFTYNPADVIYKFPLHYGDKDSCDSEFAPPAGFPLPFYYGRKIHRVNEVDGWGTLITPYGTFQSVRVKSMLTIRDTIADSSGQGFAFTRPLQYEYKWLKQGGKIPYLQVNASNVGGAPVVTNIAYRDSTRGGIPQIGGGVNDLLNVDFGLQVYPNPVMGSYGVNEYAVAQYTLDNSRDVRIELTDISGKKVGSFVNAKQSAGPHIEILNLRSLNLQSGTYFVCMYAGNGKNIQKLVLVK